MTDSTPHATTSMPMRRLTAGVYSLVVLLFIAMIAWTWHDVSYNPDEAEEVVVLRETDSFWAYRDRITNHFGANVQFYLASHLPAFEVTHLQFIAGVVTVLIVLYAMWLARAYKLFSRWLLLVPLALLVLNEPLHHYGTWGLVNYGIAILGSGAVLHAILLLARRRFALSLPATLALAVGLGLLVLNYGANLMPIVLGVGAAAVWSILPVEASQPRLAWIVRQAVIILAVVAVAGGVTLLWLTHGEFDNPRKLLQPLFFPTSDFDQSWQGGLAFAVQRSKEYAISVWLPNRHIESLLPMARGVISGALGLAFGVGMVRSFIEWHRLRFVIALTLLMCLAGLVVLSLRGTYAFGDVRYALFLHVPMLLMAGLGVADVLQGIGWLIRRTTNLSRGSLGWARFRTAAYVLTALGLIVMQGALLSRVSAKALQFNREYVRIVGLLRATDVPWVVSDFYTQSTLNYLQIDYSDRETFFLDRPFLRDEGQTRVDLEALADAAARHDAVLTVTYWPIDEPVYAPVRARLESRFEPVASERINRLTVIRWAEIEQAGTSTPARELKIRGERAVPGDEEDRS